MKDRSGRWLRLSPDVLSAMLPSFGAMFCWTLLGSLNREISQSVEYSLGTSAGWHDWLSRGNPGEVIRKWGVPLYDQWSGLGYRLPTQGMLTDTPLSYLALFLPINTVMFFACLAALWFAFSLVHRWIASWSSVRRWLTYLVVDTSLLGMISFYTLWHGWQTYIIQIAGAVVILATLTERHVIETPDIVELMPFMSCLGVGLLLLLAPHFGYAVTYVPTLVVLFSVVMFSKNGALVRRVFRNPVALTVPVLVILAISPYLLDLAREMQLQANRPDYRAESGVLDFALRHGAFLEAGQPISWVISGILMAHTFVFPLVALFDPEAYVQTASPRVLTLSWNAAAWPIRVVQFHGGVLALCLSILVLRRPKGRRVKLVERVAIGLMALSIVVALFNTSRVPGLSLAWAPVWMFSNSRWTHADVSLLLCLALFVWRSDDIWKMLFGAFRGQRRRRRLMRLGITFGLVCVICVMPYRFTETLRLNGDQTRFAALQVDSQVRIDNGQWKRVVADLRRSLYGANTSASERVFFEGESLMGGEGDNVWWGLRTHSQLRDVRLSSLLSWPRLRSGETLTPGDKFQHIVSDPKCDESIRSRLDFLSVSWSVMSSECAESHLQFEKQVDVPMPPSWTSLSSGRSLSSIMPEMVARTPFLQEGEVSAVRLMSYHHWWSTLNDLSTAPCPMLAEDCVTRLKLRRGAEVDSPPLRVCLSDCIATYELTQVAPAGSLLVIPLNYDPAIQPTQGDTALATVNFNGLLAVQSSQLTAGQIKFVVKSDIIMTLRAFAPVLISAALAIAWLARRRRGTLGGIQRHIEAPYRHD
jgi:hypothetical protein